MPLPSALARFNRGVTNRILGPLASRAQGFAVIVHEGRVSGTVYRTPVNAWHDDNSVIVALTYGRETDWLKNLRSAGGGVVVIGEHEHRVGAPVVIGPEGMGRMPAVVRLVLKTIDVDEFAVLPFLSPARPT